MSDYEGTNLTSPRNEALCGFIPDEWTELDFARREIRYLREKIDNLEARRNQPDNAFWGQLMFDAFVAAGIVWMIVLLLGR